MPSHLSFNARLCLVRPIALTTARLFWRPKEEPLKVFDFDSRSLNEVFGTMLDDNDPTERRARKKDKPKE